ncbi:MAG TPA: hypothetical protein VFA75_06435 [Nevskia sp.]|nr:hypothetical protein [Nevskia sp.]
MHISPQILRLALLRLFADASLSPGDRMDFTRLSALWPQTGLRTSDLRDAVRELLDSGELVGSGEGETLTLSLSPAGRCALSEPYGEVQMASFDDEATLFMAQHRHKAPRPPEERQRAADRAARAPA